MPLRSVIKLLIGNKSDLEGSRAVSVELAKSFAKRKGMQFFETSAKDSANVASAFQELAQTIYKSVADKEKVIDSEQ